MEPVVAVEKVWKSFGQTKVLKDINLYLERGKIYGLVGRNGSGKTVLLKCICGFISPTEGTIIVHGKMIGKDVEFAENTGFIIENPGFLPQYSGYKNLEYLYSATKKVDREKIRHYIRLVGLDPDDRKKAGKYSMGMKQRLGLAQALMEEPDLILVDEPFNGLDQRGVDEIRELFLQLKEGGRTILLVSHNREDIRVLCDEVYGMDQGVLEWIG